MTFVVGSVPEALGGRLLDHLGRLPPQVHGILDAGVETLTTERGMHVCSIARQKNAPLAIRRRLPGVVRKTGSPAQAVHAMGRPVASGECLADVLQGGLAGGLSLVYDKDAPNPVSAPGRADPPARTQAEL